MKKSELITYLGVILALCFGVMAFRAEEWGTPSVDNLEKPLDIFKWPGMR